VPQFRSKEELRTALLHFGLKRERPVIRERGVKLPPQLEQKIGDLRQHRLGAMNLAIANGNSMRLQCGSEPLREFIRLALP